MNKVPDRAKMRREYLRKKSSIIFLYFLGGGTMLFCSILGLFFLILFCLDRSAGDTRAICFACMFALSAATLAGRWLLLISAKKDTSLAYVPPVHDQLPTLPAEEVLLRGSQPSPAAPEELLRPARSAETPAEELLRSSSVGNEEVFSAE
jgi:hypothetical protein